MNVRYAPPCFRQIAADGQRQSGQALLLGMLLTGAVAVAFVRYFDTGMVVAEKARQDHALDAAAYSGALVQARGLNMLAYINRAQVAHQVAMAHLVTLGSWAHFAGMAAQRASVGNPPAHVIAMHFGPQHAAAYLGALKAAGLDAQALEQGPLAAAYAEHDRVSRSVLASAAVRVAADLVSTREQAMREVLLAHYPEDSSFALQIVDDAMPGFLTRYVGNPRLRPFLAELTSLYPFLDPRDHTARSRFPVDARCPSWRHELRRRGTTVLDEGGRWQSIDTQAYHAVRSNRWIGCYFREYAMGWGWVPPKQSALVDAPYVEDAPENFADQDFWRWVRESTRWDITGGNANPLANSWAFSTRREWAGGGLQPFQDLTAPRTVPSAHFTVSLARAGRGGLQFNSLAAAESYFRRPHSRKDARRELPNLFHPYWQARLRGRPRRRLQEGQAVVESSVAMLALAVLWVGLNWLGNYQDIALATIHASRHAAFVATRVEPSELAHGTGKSMVQRYFTGGAHHWNDRRGASVVNPAEGLNASWRRDLPLSSQAQPGRAARDAITLRADWSLEDRGLIHARVNMAFGAGRHVSETQTELLGLGVFDRAYPALRRDTYVLVGAGSALSDAAVQEAVAASRFAWAAPQGMSRSVGGQAAGRAAMVDSAWGRAEPDFDWLSRWSGRVPAHLLENYEDKNDE